MSVTLPTNLSFKEAKDNKATLTVEPCYPGYGVTLGNSLRRVLLSSITGTAITSFKIKGAQHEFSSLPYLKEDLVELMLNLKAVRLRSFSDEPVVLTLRAKGEKVVTAADIEKDAQVEIISPKAVIATLTDKNANLEMEITVKTGMGYLTVEDRIKEKLEIGAIMVDALFSPVVSVGFEIENVRVGERTDFERLILKMETDGTITPENAVFKASEILMNHFQFIQGNLSISDKKAEVKVKAEPAQETEEVLADDEKAETDEDKSKKKRGRPKKKD